LCEKENKEKGVIKHVEKRGEGESNLLWKSGNIKGKQKIERENGNKLRWKKKEK